MHENLKEKYGLSEEELKEGIETVAKKLGDICDANVMLAIAELLTKGDIQK